MFNQKAIEAKRQRANAINKPDADFLLKLASEDICERLGGTNREFSNIVELFPLTHPSPLAGNLAPQADRYEIVHSLDALAEIPSESMDLAVSCLSLHWQENIPLVMARVMSILKPDGLFLAAVPGENTLTELRSVLLQSETELAGGVSPRIDPFPSINSLGSLLQNTGYALPVVDQERLTVRYDDLFALIADLRAMAATSSLKANTRPASRLLFLRAADLYKDEFGDDDGRIRASFTLSHLSGWKPHDSQQKPLKPGSATASLKDFL